MGVCMSNTKGLVQQVRAGPHAQKPPGEHRTVVRTNVGVPVVALLTQETIQYVFNTELVDKERFYFGYAGVSADLVRGHCMSMFTNGEEHRRKKAFMIDVFKEWRKTLPSVLFKQILAHFEDWSRLEAVIDLEERIFLVVSDALTEVVFGSKLDGRLALTWLQGLFKVRTWIPIPGKARLHRLASGALPVLLESIENSPKYEDLLQLCYIHGIEEEEGIIVLMYATLFNACGSVTSTIVTSIARLYTIADTEKDNLLQTTLQTLEKHGYLSEESLGEMKSLDSFLLEVLRLHPPVFEFLGVAKKDFVVSGGKEHTEVRKGEQLMGSCFWAQRDVTAFLYPNLFRCRRFMDGERDGENKKHLLFSHGSLTEAADLDSHQCPGQDIAFFLMKATLAVLLCYCSWELKDAPVWSDKTARLGKPDKLVSLTWFNFDPDEARKVLGL